MKVRCLGKNRDSKGNIVNYNLIDETGHQFQATGKQIKVEMQSGRYEFINLQIDKAGRLIDKAETKEQSAMTIEMQAELLIEFIIDMNNDVSEAIGMNIELKSDANNKKILTACEKRYPDKLFRCNHDELVKKYKNDWVEIGYIESKVKYNKIFANFIYNNLKCIEIAFINDDMSEYDWESEEEANAIRNEIYDDLQQLIKKYETQYGMFINYEIDTGTLFINGVTFR